MTGIVGLRVYMYEPMSMPRFIIFASVITFLGCVSLQAAERPNILFIVCDDLNTHVAPSGYDAVKTPVLSTLAKEGMVFKPGVLPVPSLWSVTSVGI